MQESTVSHGNFEFETIFKSLQAKTIYWDMKSLLFQKLSSAELPVTDWINQISYIASSNKIDSKLKQLIYDVSKTMIKHDPIKTDDIVLINEARSMWTEFLIKSVISASNKVITQFNESSNRKDKDKQEDTKEKSKEEPEKELPVIYEWRHLRNACVGAVHLRSKFKDPDFGNFNISLRHSFQNMDIKELKNNYPEFQQSEKCLIGQEEDDIDYVLEREEQAELLLNKGGSLDIESFAKRGIPNGIRIQLYRKYFGIDSAKPNKSKHYHNIQESLKNHKYIIDDIIAHDVDEVLNDDRYFVFDQNLHKTIWTFFRDKSVYEKLAILPMQSLANFEDVNKVIPYCGIIPCKDFSRYATPFLYSSERPEDVYFLFREFYCKYFCFLNTLSSHQNSILRLCYLFEELLYKGNYKLMSFFVQKSIDALSIVFPWMMFCFIGYLDTEQLFVLFDRIIGYNSLEIVAILAAAILNNNSEAIMKCKTSQQVESIFENMYDINVVTSIKDFLFEL